MSGTGRPASERLDHLAALLSSQVRAEVLVHAVTRADTGHSLTELAHGLGLAISSVQHEAYKLQDLGLFSLKREGASRRYSLRLEEPVVQALRELVVATVGAPRVVEMALTDLPGLAAGSLLGAIPPRQGETALVLIGDLELETVEQAHWRASWLLDAPAEAVELAFFRPADWLARRDAGHPLVRRLLDLPVRAAFGDVRVDEQP
ncbi:MAG TPA: helix-turn-helix domain-containing protein [Thermomicrobiales bacterium]|nr:helix-turn-helix domain-containing protein [Thermomicrobiales bacterium]